MYSISIFQKIDLAVKFKPKLSFFVLSSAFALVLLIAGVSKKYIVNVPIKQTAKFIVTTPVWERTRGNWVEYFFKRKYEFVVDGKRHQFHFEEGFSSKKEAELAIERCDKSDVIIWYNKNDPKEIRLKDPGKLFFSSFFISLYLIAILFFLWHLIRTINKIAKYIDSEFANQSIESIQNTEVILSKNVVSGFRIKFGVQIILIFLVGVYYHKSVEWIAIVSWVIISIELAYMLLKGLSHNHLMIAEFSSLYQKILQRTLEKFGDILEEHFGMNGRGSINIDSIGAVLFLIVFIYLPFIVLPLLAINFIRLIMDLIFFISHKVCKALISPLSITENISHYQRFIIAFSYSITFVGLILSLIYFSIH